MKKKCLALLLICVLSFAAVSEANNQEVTFTYNEINRISQWVDFVNSPMEPQFAALEAYLYGVGTVTQEQAQAALKDLRDFQEHVRDNGSQLLNFLNLRTDGFLFGQSVLTYVLNTNSMKFHYPDCQAVPKIKESNRQDFYGTRQEVIDLGYSSCGICRP